MLGSVGGLGIGGGQRAGGGSGSRIGGGKLGEGEKRPGQKRYKSQLLPQTIGECARVVRDLEIASAGENGPFNKGNPY